jgi:hypothetical protein
MTCQKNYIKLFALGSLFFMLLFSCSRKPDKNAEILQRLYGQKIFVPRSYQENLYQNTLKIVTRINGDCAPCFHQITYWDSLYNN